ncbi:integrase core domain-containing protein [Pseudoalteromonas luteoviolacea]|uniref:Integrase catalytic domain-containing protein n=1 Tax=Pseudoalteromonas luteoviolacea H33 TaxID=1365251 RepID=A0A167EZE2_9GAMM|nr:integrase core domain-containing protein [Pseudoalteromonas luteoviolacea]KZN51400.1 hypothetical protein N476_13515 [Pseudoalteromonas luteoviolacea H33]KZN71429.1 hypothetical protein N477_03905 [Pseudoalteromonas luteoviolacea H33-S]MBQ4876784.1 integrase core domain-containing protein [Pseudoalteromonas luteoviolacea]MBQ4905427.1 integrase core domain-containing protein [Pseudoalteromonas luteoviolacea]
MIDSCRRLVERFNQRSRKEVLDLYLFELLQQVPNIIGEWLDISNNRLPHNARGELAPTGYLEAA